MSCDHSFAQSCDHRCVRSPEQAPAVQCKNKFCKHGDKCPAKCTIDYMGATKGTLDSVLAEMNEHVLSAVRDNRAIDFCYDNARRKVLRALAEKPLEMTRTEQNRLLERDQLLAEIEREVRPALTTHKDPAHAGRFLLDWLQRSNILRGQRI